MKSYKCEGVLVILQEEIRVEGVGVGLGLEDEVVCLVGEDGEEGSGGVETGKMEDVRVSVVWNGYIVS